MSAPTDRLRGRPGRTTPFTGTLQPEEDYDGLAFQDLDLTGARGASARFLECVVEGCDLTSAVLAGSRWSECSLTRVRGVGTDLTEASLVDVTVTDARLGALAAYGSTWRRVIVRGGKIEFLNLRGASLREVQFEDCVLIEPDVGDATLKDVTFSGCTLVGAQFHGAKLTAVELSDARLLEPKGLTSIGGATISRVQLLELADAFADQLGITVSG